MDEQKDWVEFRLINPSHDNNRKRAMIDYNPSKHYPGKPESKLLRKLMAQTGLTKEELRSNKKYRKMLSNEQKQNTGPGPQTKYYRGLIKKACRKTGLVPQHPKTLEVLQELFDTRGRCHRGIFPDDIQTSKQIVERYA